MACGKKACGCGMGMKKTAKKAAKKKTTKKK